MSDLVIHYDDLNQMAEELGKVAKEASAYVAALSESMIKPMGNITGGSSAYLTDAANLVRQKINELTQKAERCGNLAVQVSDLSELASTIDEEVATLLEKCNDDFFNRHESLKVSELEETIIGWLVELKNKIPILEDLSNFVGSINETVSHAKDEVKHWYYCEGGREVVELAVSIVFVVLAIVAFIAAFPASGFWAICEVIGSSLGLLNACTDVITQGQALYSSVNDNPAWARVYARQDNASDVLRATNYGSASLNQFSNMAAFGLDTVDKFCMAVDFAKQGLDYSKEFGKYADGKCYFVANPDDYNPSDLKCEIKGEYKNFTVDVPAGEMAIHMDDMVESGNKYSAFGEMSDVDGEKYLEFLEHGSKEGFSDVNELGKVDEFLNVNKRSQNEALELTDSIENNIRFTSEEINKLKKTVISKGQSLKDEGLTKEQLGPAIAGAYDKATGKIYTAINNIDGKVPSELSQLIKERLENMTEDIYESYAMFTKGAGSHAEVYAVNELLLDNKNARIDDIIVYVNRTLGPSKPVIELPFKTCPHCKYILEGFFILSNQ